MATSESDSTQAPATRRTFEMSEADLAAIMDACRSGPLIALQCGMPPSPQERANAAWCDLGKRMGFDGMTVEPTGSANPRIFSAVATP